MLIMILREMSHFLAYQSKHLLGPYFMSVWWLSIDSDTTQIPWQLSNILQSVMKHREEFIKIQQFTGFQNKVYSNDSKPAQESK